MSDDTLDDMRALKVAYQTSDAYSADIWGSVMWTQAAQMLLDMGFTEQQARAVLRSKLTRWAQDAYGERSTWLGQLCYLVRKDRGAIEAGLLGDGHIMEATP